MKYFITQELVDRKTYELRGERSLELMDSRQIITIESLRGRYGPMTINNWHVGGDRHWSGLRTSNSPWYSRYSQHTFGRATDSLFRDVTAEEVKQDIIKNPRKFPHIHGLELEVEWLHVDCRNYDGLKTF